MLENRRELNPALFGDTTPTRSRLVDPTQMQALSAVTPLEEKVSELQHQMGSLMTHLSQMASQFNEFVKTTQNRMDRFQQSLVRLEQADQALSLETAHRVAHLQNKVGDRKMADLRVQEMIDRHNSILRSFEVRMNLLQKLLAEKESQMHSARSLLGEAKTEIARLKRL